MIPFNKRATALFAATGFAASGLLFPGTGFTEDSAALLTQAAGSFRLVDDAIAVAVSGPTQTGSETLQAAPAAPPPVSVPDTVDLAALYYYAQQGQDDRVAAETARLRMKYPQFEVPPDLFLPPATLTADETALWQLYEKNDFTGIDAEIVRRRSETPDWRPSDDFTLKLARKKQRVLMTEAAGEKNWTGVIQAGAAIDPATETETDLLWNLIDAYAGTGMTSQLATVYRGILLREGDKRLADDVLVTTLEKAVRDFPAPDVRAIMERIAVTPELKSALQPVRFALLRKTIADFNADAQQTAPLAQDMIADLEAVIATKPQADDMAVLGWYHLKIKQPVIAAQWFGKALGLKRDAASAKGLYLSLAAQNLERDAYEVAASHLQDLSDDPEFLMNALSLRFAKPDGVMIDAAIVASYSTTILQTLNADHAEIIAWYAYNSKQYEAAAAWFRKAVDWNVAPARVKGLALSQLRLSDKQGFAETKVRYGEVYPEIWAQIKAASPPKGVKGAPVVKPRAIIQANYLRNFQAKRYGACISDLNDLKARGQLTPGAAVIGGWCYLGLSRLSEAKAFFAQALEARGALRDDAAYGTALALLRAHLTDDAQTVLDGYPMNAQRDREIRSEIYVQRARAAFDHKQYQKVLDALNARASLVAEPADLSQLRGWAYYHLGNKKVANQVFQRLSQHLADAGVRRGLIETGRMESDR